MLKKLFLKTRAFTLVEIMVVIAIIGILSTLIMVSLDNTKMTARNTRRLADIKQIQLALKTYYNDAGMFPTMITAGSSIARNGVNYMLRVPQNPKPWADNGCPDQDYQYKQLEGGQRYSLSFCVGDVTDDLAKGSHTATSNGILDCPTGYIAVPGSSTFETNDFCVMKYEAKCATTAAPTVGLSSPLSATNNTYNNSGAGGTACSGLYAPVSVSTGLPIANISQTNAITYCQNIGGHLMTNAEWMTIARNVEQINSNWSGGSVGSGALSQGNYGVTNAMDGSAAYGSGGGSFSYKRDMTLSNGEIIKDLSGNVYEWTDNTCVPGTGVNFWHNVASAYNWSNAVFNDYERAIAGPSNSTWSQTQAMGHYFGCTSSGNAFFRGSAANVAATATGIYFLNLNYTPSYTSTLVGFRCVK